MGYKPTADPRVNLQWYCDRAVFDQLKGGTPVGKSDESDEWKLLGMDQVVWKKYMQFYH